MTRNRKMQLMAAAVAINGALVLAIPQSAQSCTMCWPQDPVCVSGHEANCDGVDALSICNLTYPGCCLGVPIDPYCQGYNSKCGDHMAAVICNPKPWQFCFT